MIIFPLGMANNQKNILQREISLRPAFSDKAKETFYNEFTNLMESGVDVQRIMTLLIEEESNQKTKSVLESVLGLLVKGNSLSDSFKESGHFSAYEYQSIKIGEETGRLKIITEHLSEYFSSKVKLRRQLVGVFTYPAFVIVITIGVLYFMLNSVVPMFEDVFKQFGADLPYLTQKIIVVSKHFSTFLLYFIGVIVMLVVIGYTNKDKDWYRNTTSRIIMKLPVFGPLIKQIYVTRCLQSLSLLLYARTPLVRSLELVEEMIKFYPIEHALKQVQKDVVKGELLHKGLSKFTIFDRRLISLTKIAEETNQLDKTYDRLARQYQEDIEYKTKLIGTIIEPMIIVIIGGIVGVIMVAMYLPMFNLSNVIK